MHPTPSVPVDDPGQLQPDRARNRAFFPTQGKMPDARGYALAPVRHSGRGFGDLIPAHVENPG